MCRMEVEEHKLPHYSVGIDPPAGNAEKGDNVMGVCILRCDFDRPEKGYQPVTLGWYKVELVPATRFDTAEEWVLYACEQCVETIKDVARLVDPGSKGGVPPSSIVVTVEQQRYRRGSLLEGSLVTGFMGEGWKVRAPHPKKWKKKVGLVVADKGHKANKLACEFVVFPLLKAYHDETFGVNSLRPGIRIEDMCDAYKLAEYGALEEKEDRR